mmetsp:Transcript_45368/g.135647  ORF Transcript_45368/g.135647 Transcript_45368/m.135647 type:complete len:377 (-) Transcript_45368:27-1157(-)
MLICRRLLRLLWRAARLLRRRGLPVGGEGTAPELLHSRLGQREPPLGEFPVCGEALGVPSGLRDGFFPSLEGRLGRSELAGGRALPLLRLLHRRLRRLQLVRLPRHPHLAVPGRRVQGACLPCKLQLQLLQAQAVEGPPLVRLPPEHGRQHGEQLCVEAVVPAELPEGRQPLLAAGPTGRGVLQRLKAIPFHLLEPTLSGLAAPDLSLSAAPCSPRGLDHRLLLLDRLAGLCQLGLLLDNRLLQIAQLGLCICLRCCTSLLLRPGPVDGCACGAVLILQCALHIPDGLSKYGGGRLLADVPLALGSQPSVQPPQQELQALGQLTGGLEPGNDRLALLCREGFCLGLRFVNGDGSGSGRALRGQGLGGHGLPTLGLP